MNPAGLRRNCFAIVQYSDRCMPIRVAGHAVRVHDYVLVCIGMAVDTCPRSGVLDVTIRAVHPCMLGRMCGKLLLGVLMA